MEFDIGEIIVDRELEIGEVDFDVVKERPPLEDLEVTPSSIEQNFNHPNSYGYDNVKVKAVSSDTLNITPTTESQAYTGLYGTVNISAVDNTIDSDIQASNIKDGVNILGVTGTIEPKIIEQPPNYVMFIDYDGTVLYSYTKQEVQALTEMPPLPERKGYTYQKWNWTLQGLKQAGSQIVGAIRMTNDKSTQFTFEFYNMDLLSPTLTFQLQGGSIVVNWGDGTSETFTNASSSYQTITTNHTYTTYGKYVISLKMSSDEGYYRFNNIPFSGMYINRLVDVCIGEKCTQVGTFDSCASLKTVSIPDIDYLIANSLFTTPFRGTQLQAFVFPADFPYAYNKARNLFPNSTISIISFSENYSSLSIGDNCTKIKYFILPNKVTSLEGYGARAMSDLYAIIMPSNVKNIGTSAITGTNIKVIDLSMYNDPSDLPTLESTSWAGANSGCVLYVKNQEMKTAFEGATNWSAYVGKYEIGGEYAN